MPDIPAAVQNACEPWAQTYTGRAVDLLRPDPLSIDIEDIAVTLARIPRFNGHTRTAWSVAAHSLAVERVCQPTGTMPEPAERLIALLHDAHEAYTGDIINPMQVAIGKGGIRDVQYALQQAIHHRFGLPTFIPEPTRGMVKHADLVMLATEKAQLMGPEPRPWVDLPPPADLDLSHKDFNGDRSWWWRFNALMKQWHGLT